MSQILMLALGDGNCARTAYAVLEKAKAMKRSASLQLGRHTAASGRKHELTLALARSGKATTLGRPRSFSKGQKTRILGLWPRPSPSDLVPSALLLASLD